MTAEDKRAPNRFSRMILVLAVAAVSGAPIAVFAQEDEEEVYDLSPFTVDAGDSQGYSATSTLAGTRLKTNLRDIASTITVVTKDFIEDTNSTDLKELLVYTPSTEVVGPIGNFSVDNGQSGEGTVRETFDRLTPRSRVRGLAEATLTRSYYESIIPMDSYNTERVTVNRGANSILFGVGSPAGIINTGLVAPVFDNRTQLTGRVGSYGSYRGTFDIERVLLDEKLSIRATGLYEDRKFQQDPAFEEDQRIFLAATWKPTEDLTIRANVEGGNLKANLPRQFPLVDMIRIWFDPVAHPEGLFQPTHNALEVTANGPYSASYFGPQPAIFVPSLVFSDPSSGTVNSSLNPTGTAGILGLKQPFWHPAGSPNRQADWWAAIRGTGRNMRVWNDGANSAIAGKFSNHQVTDSSIIDFRNHLIDGNNKLDTFDFETFNVSAEHLFWDGNIGVELAYDHQTSFEERRMLLTGGRSEALMVDPTVVLPDGTINSNAGRPFVGWNNGDWTKIDNESDVFRVTAFAKLNATDWTDSLLGKIIGDHTMTLLYEDRDAENFNRGGPLHTWGKDYAEFGIRNDNGRYVNASLPRVTGHSNQGGVFYLGESLLGASQLSGANIQPSLPDINIEDSYTITVHNYNTDSWENRSFSVERESPSRGTKGGLERESEALVMNSRWLNDHLVATYGWRKDTILTLAETAPQDPFGNRYRILGDPDFLVLDTPSGPAFEDTTFSWGVVGHLPNDWLEDLPIDSLSLHYAEAENRIASGAIRKNIFGEDLPSPLGETEEIGFTVGFLQNNLTFRANWYETAQLFRTETALNALRGLIPFVLNRVGAGTIATEVIEENFYMQDDIADLANYPAQPQQIVDAWDIRLDANGFTTWTTPPNLAATSDAVSEGFEFEMVGNLTNNWTVSLSSAKQKVARTNSGPALQRYIYGEFNQVALWSQDAFGKYPSALGNLLNIGNRIPQVYLDPLNLVTLQDGAGSSDEIREWRHTLVTSYRFDRDGKLKGWTIGGSARWQDEVAIGYPEELDPSTGTYLPVLSNPHFGPSELNVDGFVRYNTRIFDDKVDMTLTLNVRNLFDEDDLIPVRANPNAGSSGINAIWRIPQERNWFLSARFGF